MNSKLLLARRWFVTIFLLILAMAAYVVGWRVTEINPVKLITSLPKSQKILSDLIHPDLVTRDTQNSTFDVVFPVPCGSAPAGRRACPPPQSARRSERSFFGGTTLDLWLNR